MTQTIPFTIPLRDCSDVSQVGGKAANLGRLIAAGFPVPDGFVLTTRAYAAAHELPIDGRGFELPHEIAEEVAQAYRDLGGGAVAVRSSATAEDMGDASMAGQYETFLDVQGESALFDAILRCWSSLDAPRTRAYLAEHGIDLSEVSMAVVVQKLIPADVAGVLFTANPHANGKGHWEMLLEASWGLGESVVAGRVQPDVLRIDHSTGRVLSATIASKRVQLSAGAHQERPVDGAKQNLPCLAGRDVHRLWQLGQRTASYFGSPQDIEWAIAGGELYLIQSRPITTRQQAETIERQLRDARKHLRSELAAGRGPWVLHNLAETLPHPTPLTWSVMQRFMSGSGGFGAMYRKAGFEPSSAADRDGFLELIGGRIYMDAARATEMFYEAFPFKYDLEELKRRPDASAAPPTLPRGGLWERLAASKKLRSVGERLRNLSHSLDRELRDVLFPEIEAYVAKSKPIDLRSLSTEWLIELWQEHEKLVLGSFAPQLLLPSLISAMALDDLRAFLADYFWDDDPDALSQLISAGGLPNRTLLADQQLYEVGKGACPLDQWLKEHGHRAAGEFDLSVPRWRERPGLAREMADRLASGDAPLERHRQTTEKICSKIEALRDKLRRKQQAEFDRRLDLTRRYILFREDGKDLLMLGYDLLRDIALEAGRRLEIGEGVFYLTRDEMFDAVRLGFAPLALIEQRKLDLHAQRHISLPRVIDAAAVDALGEPADAPASVAGAHKAFAVSGGEASGPARVLRSPNVSADLGKGYVLVCPSTDPSWTPLFINAAGLVLECGGALSHGAVVAREMGLPAVVLADATQLFQDGESIRVDGTNGWAGRLADLAIAPVNESSSLLRHQLPPLPGPKDRIAARWRNRLIMVWTIFLIAFFTLPDSSLRLPTFAAIDTVLWPIVRAMGKPGAVVAIAIAIALIALLLQRFLTDNPRLLEAKRRAAALMKQAGALPKDSPRRAAMLRAAAPIPWRTLAAAMVPIGLLLGPMVLPMLWFSHRVNPSAWNAPQGSTVQIVALVDGEWSDTIRLDVPQDVTIDSSTPAVRSLPPIRKTLERLLDLYRQPKANPTDPWEIQLAPDLSRRATADDLEAYLRDGIPPQGVTWMIRPPSEMNGRFRITLTPAGHMPMAVDVALGDDAPPAAPPSVGPRSAPLREVRVVYPRPKTEPVFLRPLAGLAAMEHLPLAGWLSRIDIGWLGVYLAAYLPAVLITRALLKVA